MAKHRLDRDRIWEKIAEDERLPKQKTIKKKSVWKRGALISTIVLFFLLYFYGLIDLGSRQSESIMISESRQVENPTQVDNCTYQDSTILEDEVMIRMREHSSTKSEIVSTLQERSQIRSRTNNSEYKDSYRPFAKETAGSEDRSEHLTREKIMELSKEIIEDATDRNFANNTESKIQNNTFGSGIALDNTLESDKRLGSGIPTYNNRNSYPSYAYSHSFLPNLRMENLQLRNRFSAKLDLVPVDKIVNSNSSKSSSVSFEIGAAYGIGNYKIDHVDATPLVAIYPLKLLRFTEATFGVNYAFRSWQVGVSIDLDQFKVRSMTNTLESIYVENEISKRIEKRIVSTDFTWYQNYRRLSLGITIGRVFRIGGIALTPRVGIRYALSDLSSGSVLEGNYTLTPLADLTIKTTPIAFDGGVRVHIPTNRQIQWYIEIGHLSNSRYQVQKVFDLRMNSSYLQFGSFYLL